ncbi:MAG: pyridoxine 5'-phosphate synthase [Kiritimatiellae bacterium]|nr:pyridoxine 5'-phosphate synthase [Kiritimatiellia bacterium]
MTHSVNLGVNIDHVATVRQARRTIYPSVVDAAMLCQEAGAHGITVHLREDRRHIQDADVYQLKSAISLPLNLELADTPEIVAIALDVKPAEVCVVPEKRAELTTEGGLDVIGGGSSLAASVDAFRDAGIACSLFIDPAADQIRAASSTGAPIIELHTGTFCDASGDAAVDDELTRLIEAAELAHSLGLQVNAGHGIHLGNIDAILRVPHLHTLNIGHSIVSRAVLIGMTNAVREMLGCLAAS